MWRAILGLVVVGAGISTASFVFVHNITSSELIKSDYTISCRGRCNREGAHGITGDCMCDEHCMFLGDCCYDYLLECDNKDLDLASALDEQSHFFQHFKQFSTCEFYYLEELSKSNYVMQISTCPTDAPDGPFVQYCYGLESIKTFSWYIPVVARGILFKNAYCAACHGVRLQEVEMATASNNIKCKQGDIKPQVAPFQSQFPCEKAAIDIANRLDSLGRFKGSCSCETTTRVYSQCDGGIFKDECHAYTAVIGSIRRVKAKNTACLKCAMDEGRDIDSTADPKLVHCEKENAHQYRKSESGEVSFILNLFKFTDFARAPDRCSSLYTVGQPGNKCLVQTCQAGYRLHEGQCLSLNDSKACLDPQENFYNDNYEVAQMFKPAMMLFIDKSFWENFEAGAFQGSSTVYGLMSKSLSCSAVTMDVYRDTVLGYLHKDLVCRLLYFSVLSFTDVVRDMEDKDYTSVLLPNVPIERMIVMNHDPVSGVTCTAGVHPEPITHSTTNSKKHIEFRTRKMDRVFMSNRDPVIISKGRKRRHDDDMWVLLCKPHNESPGCNSKDFNSYANYVACPKYELKMLPSFWKTSITLSSGEELLASEFMTTSQDHVLVCSDIYDEEYKDFLENQMAIAVSTCYSVSLLCLLTTFLIHLRYRPLRTLPGLMLMNLIVALFLAQFMYLMNSFGLFLGEPIICQVMATAQHYFWLASFAWMACMSLDIFNCLSTSCTTVNTYIAAKYFKYVLVGWLAPMPIPLVANVLTNTAAGEIGYDSSLCWLSGAKAVLFLFALPVLSIVGINIILFVGSVCRLCALLQNAAYVGRKEDNKQRLIQCIKLSSWMGISWLFGIIPNFLDIDALWYVFAVVNAFQGVHIFFAFGVTGRARVLMRRGVREKNVTSMVFTTSVPSISTGLDVD